MRQAHPWSSLFTSAEGIKAKILVKTRMLATFLIEKKTMVVTVSKKFWPNISHLTGRTAYLIVVDPQALPIASISHQGAFVSKNSTYPFPLTKV